MSEVVGRVCFLLSLSRIGNADFQIQIPLLTAMAWLRFDGTHHRKERVMSCGGEATNGWSARTPLEQAAPVVAARWAEYIKTEVPGKMHSLNQPMNPGQATACTMTFNGTAYNGRSQSTFHGEVDCLNQAYNNDEDLGSGQFTALTNPVCQVCAAVLYGVGVTTVPNMAGSSKEYGNYRLPEWIFSDERENGILYRIIGKDAWHVWINHVSEATRGKAESRQRVVTEMTKMLRKY
ncbi:hypothetical protein AB0O28_39560 [Microbispora sp. NPDC088329]|uniref:hypothetical protein n=1 Tax=Microbispora sp. NPDC088329 TaxID=3154869 RepID=UPI00342AB0A6